MFPTLALVLFPISKGKSHGVYVRITCDRRTRYFSLRKQGSPENWDATAMRFTKGHPDFKRVNDLLQTHHQRAADLLRGYERDGTPFTFERFEQDFFGRPEGRIKTVVSYAAEVAAMLESQGNLGNSKPYLWLSALLRAYSPKAVFQDVSLGWLRKLEHFMRTKRNLHDGGISAHLRTLRAVCNRSIADGVMPEGWQPFKGFDLNRLSKPDRSKLAIPISEIRKFEAVEGLNERERLYVDLFLFSFYCRGMNLADIAELRKSNVNAGRLTYRRKKTGRAFDIRLVPQAVRILERYAGPSPYLFPIYDEGTTTEQLRHQRKSLVTRLTNRGLKKTAERIGLPESEKLVFYTARHTYATALKQKGVSVEMISELLGHDSILTTRAYLKDFETTALDMADDALHGG